MSDAEIGAGNWRLDWPVSSGTRVASAYLKTAPEDFRVSEVMGEFPEHADSPGLLSVTGEGEHLCLYLEKTGDNTEFVAGALATLTGCRSFDVGFCGLKDRHAVTRQWFSLYRPGMMEDDTALIDQVSERWPVKSAHRSVRKLRRGDHQGNHFVITLRHVSASREMVESAVGMANAEVGVSQAVAEMTGKTYCTFRLPAPGYSMKYWRHGWPMAVGGRRYRVSLM